MFFSWSSLPGRNTHQLWVWPVWESNHKCCWREDQVGCRLKLYFGLEQSALLKILMSLSVQPICQFSNPKKVHIRWICWIFHWLFYKQECGLLEPHHLIGDLCIPLFVAYHVSVSSWLTGWVCWCSALEGAEATLLSASGMCVTTTMLLALVPGGGHIVTTTDCYRRTRQFIQTVLPKMGITVLPSTSLGFWVGIKLFILWVKNMMKFSGTGMVYAWVKLEEQLMIFCVQ
jgi:hypothetical protein